MNINYDSKILRNAYRTLFYISLSACGALLNMIVKFIFLTKYKEIANFYNISFPLYDPNYLILYEGIITKPLWILKPFEWALLKPIFFFGDWIQAPKFYVFFINGFRPDNRTYYISIGDILIDIGLMLAFLSFINLLFTYKKFFIIKKEDLI